MEHVKRAAPDEARACVIAVLGTGTMAGSVHTAIARLGDLWDGTMDEALFKLLKRRTIEAYEAAMIVEHLGAWPSSDAQLGIQTDQEGRQA